MYSAAATAATAAAATTTTTTNYPGTKLVDVVIELRNRMKNSSCAHVLHKTLNLVIARCCFGKEMH